MGEGTNVGKIFLDLIVRNTVEKQIREITAEGQRVAQNAFSGVENAAERMACGVTTQTGSVVKKSAAAIERASASLADTFNKPVALAQARLNQLEQTAVELSAKLEDEFHKDFSFKLFGYVTDDNKTVAQIQKQLDKVHSQIKAAEDRLAIEKEAAAQKAAAAAERAALRQAMAAPKAAEKAAAAAQKETLKREAAEQKAAAAAEKAAQKAAAAEAKAANRRKAVTAAMWKNMLSHTGNGAKAIASKISGIGKHFGRASKSANGFGTRLRGLVSGALVFNVLSNGLRRMTSYIGQTLASTDEMRSALANLKGAAANAASPLIQVLTPALAALANTAATVFSYVSRLLTLLTGKISNASSMAAKSASGTAAAVRHLPGPL